MSGWIKFDKDMADDPRLLEAAAKLGKRYVIAVRSPGGGSDLSESDHLAFACNAVTGALVTLWKYADVHIRDDDTLPMSRETLDAMVKIVGFFDLMPRDWINQLDDGTIILPGYCEKNSLIAKKKASIKSNARVTAFRARKKVSGNSHVTHHSTRYTTVSKVVDQDQDQDLYQDQKKEKEGMQGETRAARSLAARLPEDWQLTENRKAVAEQEGADAARTFANFTDYWKAAGGQKARKHDWDAAWRIWCRREGDTRQKPRKTRYEEIVEPLEARIRNG